MTDDNVRRDSKTCEEIKQGDLHHGDRGKDERNGPQIGEPNIGGFAEEPELLDERVTGDGGVDCVHLEDALLEHRVSFEKLTTH